LWPLRADAYVLVGLGTTASAQTRHFLLRTRKKAVSIFETLQDELGDDTIRAALIRHDPSPTWLMRHLLQNNTIWPPVALRGSWGGPLFGQPGVGLLVDFSEHTCLSLIQREEARAQEMYSWVVVTRIDLHWLGPHFSLSGELALSSTALYVPWGQENGGINDRHIVLPRGLANRYLSQWMALVDRSAAYLPVAQQLELTNTRMDTRNACKLVCAFAPNRDPYFYSSGIRDLLLVSSTMRTTVCNGYRNKRER